MTIKNDKAEQEALKEVEIIAELAEESWKKERIVAELAPNEKTRKEAEKLIETVENESTTSLQEQQRKQYQILNQTLLHKTVLKFLIHISKAS